MASTYSPNLRLELVADGEQTGVWGDTVNTTLGTTLEAAITGVQSISITGLTTRTLTVNNGVPDEARSAVLRFTGALAVDCAIIAPAVPKIYVVNNETTGGFNLLIKTASAASTSIPPGIFLVYCDGTLFHALTGFATGGTISGAVAIAGNMIVTGVTTLASTLNGALVASSGVVSSVVPGTAGNLLTSTGTAWSSAVSPLAAPNTAGNVLRSNGTAWASALVGDVGFQPQYVNQLYSAFTTTGTISPPTVAYTLTPAPALAAYVANDRYNIKLDVTPSFPPTINISGLGAVPFMYFNSNGARVYLNSTAVSTVLGSWRSDCYYDAYAPNPAMIMMDVISRVPVSSGRLRTIFGYGYTSTYVGYTNLVDSNGVVYGDVAGVGATRYGLAAAGYSTDKAIFGFGYNTSYISITNLVSNLGAVQTDTVGVDKPRTGLAAATYDTTKAIFAYGNDGGPSAVSNLVSSAGVVATYVVGVGTARSRLAAATYGSDKVIFGYGYISSNPGVSTTNLVSNVGIVTGDVTGVGTARSYLAAAGYAADKAIFGYGFTSAVVSWSNLVSNVGIVATDTAGVGTARQGLAAGGYGLDKAIFGYGTTGTNTNVTNLVSNVGVVMANQATVTGTSRSYLAAASYSLT